MVVPVAGAVRALRISRKNNLRMVVLIQCSIVFLLIGWVHKSGLSIPWPDHHGQTVAGSRDHLQGAKNPKGQLLQDMCKKSSRRNIPLAGAFPTPKNGSALPGAPGDPATTPGPPITGKRTPPRIRCRCQTRSTGCPGLTRPGLVAGEGGHRRRRRGRCRATAAATAATTTSDQQRCAQQYQGTVANYHPPLPGCQQ